MSSLSFAASIMYAVHVPEIAHTGHGHALALYMLDACLPEDNLDDGPELTASTGREVKKRIRVPRCVAVRCRTRQAYLHYPFYNTTPAPAATRSSVCRIACAGSNS